MLMDEDNPPPPPVYAEKGTRLDNSGSYVGTKCESIFITYIHATDVASSLRRVPAGFYVAVEFDGRILKTSNKPVLVGKDVVEWDEAILLPSARTSGVTFRVYASFELGPMLGKGELLQKFDISVGDMLDRDEQLLSAQFQDNIPFPSCSSLKIITEPRICDTDPLEPMLDSSESDAMSPLAQFTDAGHDVLLRYRELQNQVDLDDAIMLFECARDMCPPSHPNRSAVLSNLANAKFIHCQANNAYADLDVPIALYRNALQLRTSVHPDHCATALDLSLALLTRFKCQGRKADRTEAQDLLSRVVNLSPVESHGHRAAFFALQMAETTAAVHATESRIPRTNKADPDDALIRRARASLLDVTDQNIRRATLLANLGRLLYGRFDRNGDLADIHEAILLLENAMQLTPDGHPEKPEWLSVLGSSLARRVRRVRTNLADVNKSILIFEKAVHLTPGGHPDLPGRLSNLGNSLLSRFERLGDLTDISRSAAIQEEAVHLTPDSHHNKPILLYNLGHSLLTRFERLGDLADIDKAILMFEDSVRLTPDGHPLKPIRLNNLGKSLSRRFKHLGDLADINKSILVQENAINLAPKDHQDIPTLLDSLGNSLTRRFQHLGDLADIDNSISVQEKAVCLTPDYHPDKPALFNNLGSSLFRRFGRLDDLADINKSILMFEEAVRLTPDGYAKKPNLLNSLGSSLFRRFQRLGDVADLNKSVSVKEEAVRLTPNGHPDRPSRLNNLGNSLLSRSEYLGDLVDLSKSVSMQEEVLCLTPNDHPDKATRLNNLGRSLSRRFQHLGDISDIKKSISMYEQAVCLTPDSYPNKSLWLTNLGNALMDYYDCSHDMASLSAATVHFSAATRLSTGSVFTRFHAARCCISSARLGSDSDALLDAYATSINLLPELAWLGLPLEERHRVLFEAADIARNAAATALEAGCPEKAVEWLEQGRSIVWSQFIQLRTPVDQLRIEHAALADQFQQVSQELERASSQCASKGPTPHMLASDLVADGVSLEKEVRRHHELALTREKLLAEIRSLPGFDRFLLPKTIEQLAPSAHSGPVVYLNASKQRCDALIIMEELANVIPVPLPGVSYSQLELMQRLLRLLLERNRLIISRNDITALIPSAEDTATQHLLDMLMDCDRQRAAKIKPQRIAESTPDDLFGNILTYLWVNVVNPVLEILGFSTTPCCAGEMAHIYWCPTGPFAFLPIHAAGLYGTAEGGSKLSDFAVSSYIPTLSAFAPPTEKDLNGPASNTRLVAVRQSPTDGLGSLASVEEEINHIKALSNRSPFVTLRDSHGTIDDVTEKMQDSEWVHFACHGVQDPRNPLDSGLCLADRRRLKLSDIIRLSCPRGGLAFLSACQTAQGDENLPEESVHLAAGMLLAGYGGVIATMWAIQDLDAPKVAKDVYGHLFRDGKIPDSMEAAEALHFAVQRLRDSGASFFSWVPFIHVGR